MFPVFKREFKAMFCGYRAYLFFGIFAVAYLVIRMMYNYMLLYDNLMGFINHEYILSFLPAAVALATPVITFSMYEIERKNNVFSLLRSLPLTDKGIIFGKYLSRAALFGVVYALFIIIDLLLGSYSGSPILTVIYSALSYILIANCIIAINVFLATACKNKFVALGIGYGIAAMFILLTVFLYSMPRFLIDVLTPISLFGTYTSALFGMVDISSIVTWVTVGGFFIWLSYKLMKKEMNF